MYCYHCGNKVNNSMKKCPYCGGIFEDIESLIFENTLDELAKSLGQNDKSRFSAKIGNSYITINGDKYIVCRIYAFMKNITDKTEKELKDYIHYTSYKNLAEVGYKKINKMIEKVIYAAIVFLKNMNTDVKYDSINNSDFNFYIDTEYIWEPIYISADDFSDLHEALLEARKKLNRGRKTWIGGGFGVKGAIKGSVTAGIMNTAENTVRRSMMAGVAKIYENSAKNTLKEDPRFVKEIVDRWKEFIFEVAQILVKKLCDDYDYSINELSEFDKYLNNVTNNKMSEKESVEAINQCPFNIDGYINLYAINKKYCSELVRLARFCGIEQEVLQKFVISVDSKKISFKPIGIDIDAEQLMNIKSELVSLEKNNPAYSRKYDIKFIKEEQEYHKKVNELITKVTSNTLKAQIEKIFKSNNIEIMLKEFLLENGKFAENDVFQYLLDEVKILGEKIYISYYKDKCHPLIYDALLIAKYNDLIHDKYANCTLKKEVTEKLIIAAQAGRTYPMAYIGVGRCEGRDFISKNKIIGEDYLKRSAEHNCILAIAYLGCFYKRGSYGFKRDINLGNKYLKIAADAGNKLAKKELAKL